MRQAYESERVWKIVKKQQQKNTAFLMSVL